jgi:hypothetical protein
MNKVGLNQAETPVELKKSESQQKRAYSNIAFGAAADTVQLQSKPQATPKQGGISPLGAAVWGTLTGLVATGVNWIRSPKDENKNLVEKLNKLPSEELVNFKDGLIEKIEKLNPNQMQKFIEKIGFQFDRIIGSQEQYKGKMEKVIELLKAGKFDEELLNEVKSVGTVVDDNGLIRAVDEMKNSRIKIIEDLLKPESFDKFYNNVKREFEALNELAKTKDIKSLKEEANLNQIKKVISSVIMPTYETKIPATVNQAIEKAVSMSKTKAAIIGAVVGIVGYVAAKLTVLKPTVEKVQTK